MPASLGPEERAVVDEAVADVLAGPRPTDRGPVGCLMAMPGFLILVVAPLMAPRLDLPVVVGTMVLIAGGALLVIGLVLHFSAGRFARGHYMTAAEAGMRGLEAWDPETDDREDALRGATLVLLNAMAALGAAPTASIDIEKGRERIGALMPMVEAVEEYLVAQGSSYRVFTKGPEGDG